MKTLVLIISLILGATNLFVQDWVTDLDEAMKLASENDKKIVLVFQGSDWCAPCIKLEREIWNSEAFKNYAKDHYVMLKADFPRRKKNQLSKEQQEKNNILAEKYNKNGFFPLVLVLDKNAEVLGETGYKNLSVEEYIEILNSF